MKQLRLILLRHEETDYSDGKLDLKPQGIEKSKRLGQKLIKEKIIDNSKRILLLHSQKSRTKNTLENIAEGAEISEPMLETPLLQSNDPYDIDYILKREHELNLTQEDIAKEYYENTVLYNKSPHIVETNDNRRKRFYTFLTNIAHEHLINKSDYTYVIAVTHFEILMHLINDLFDIKSFSTYITPAVGEYIIIDIACEGKPNLISINATFRNTKSWALFNLDTQEYDNGT